MNNQGRNDYLNPAVTQVNRLPASARTFTEAETVDLGGEWQFRLFETPEACLDEFVRAGCAEGFKPIQVPGNWQLQGFGEPIYTNYLYPWKTDGEYGVDGKPDPWKIPKENPTGCYRKTVFLDHIDQSKTYILRFGGVETAYELYVNGVFAGYAEDSKLASAFDVTEYLCQGENLIALKVYTYATSSYLEDQDYWYLNGIFRPVTLAVLPKKHIEDYQIKAVPDRWRDNAVLTADVKVTRASGIAKQSVRLTLTDANGAVIGQECSKVSLDCGYTIDMSPTANTARVTLKLDSVDRWYPEKPVLYSVLIELLDETGAVTDAVKEKIGFKRVDIENGILKLNGQRALIFGVNRHDCAWMYGRAVPEEHMRREIAEMKRMNVNAVRTCHYPDSDLWYSLCDELGILVLCECDLETHGVSGMISHDAAFAPAYVERAQRMVAQHKNHVSIFGWSLGNESGYGPGHAAMYGLVKQMDDTRLCQYEAGLPGPNISDTWGKMYATEREILMQLGNPNDTRPIMLVEFLYQIRNAGGGMRKFVDLMRRYPRFQGGFIWDWQDKALPGYLPDGTPYFAHGGDFGERFVDPEVPLYMTNNGIVRADLAWKPVAHDVREAYAPMLIENEITDNVRGPVIGSRRFMLINRSLSESSEAYEYTVSLMDKDGKVFSEEHVSIPETLPGEQNRFEIVDNSSAYILFTVARKSDGAEVSRKQFDVGAPMPVFAADEAEGASPELVGGKQLTVKNAAVTVSFDSETGLPSLAESGDGTLFGGVRVTLDRPYCGLDAKEGWGWRERMDAARNTVLRYGKVRVLRSDESIEISNTFEGKGIRGEYRWTLGGGKKLDCLFSAQIEDGFIPPRIGLELTLPSVMESVSYKGYGPWETYSDRLYSAVYGTYETTADELGFDYAPPSENGGREGVTQIVFGGNGRSLTVNCAAPIHFDAHHSTVEAFKQAMHTHEVKRDEALTVHLDAYHMPIGGDMAWSTMIDPADIPKAGVYTMRIRFE